jgi:transposase-like protein
MTLDESLLKKARAESERLSEAERQAVVARAEYHTAVRRLHLAGGSLREIAEALGLSHQRVQQMVDGAGGTWWQRAWGSRKRDANCTFCGRPPSEVGKLVAGPNVYICDGCVSAAERATAGRSGGAITKTKSAMARCSFCGKRAAAGVAAAKICSDCLRITRQIMDGRRG